MIDKVIGISKHVDLTAVSIEEVDHISDWTNFVAEAIAILDLDSGSHCDQGTICYQPIGRPCFAIYPFDDANVGSVSTAFPLSFVLTLSHSPK